MARNRQRARDRKQGLQQPTHENVSGELEHASGEVDEFDAALISGAGGEPAAGGGDNEPPFDEPDFDDDDDGGDDEGDRHAAAAGPRPGGNRVLNFLRASWAELQRVQWPDRPQVAQATAVVLGFVAVAGLYLGVADVIAQEIVDRII
jgi:preprotein translocase subunit SecE